MKSKVISGRTATWDLERLTVTLPISGKIALIVKNAVENKRILTWELNVRDGEKE